jgi:teichuronic acid biosynthesis glycosyltransferase TuaC
MPARRLRILVLSDLFPDPVRPAFGIFVERQVFHLQADCDNVVVVPTRVFPPLRLWKRLLNPRRFFAEWRMWQAELNRIPIYDEVNGVCVYYPRYTSPPKQVFHGIWGFFAYLFILRQLRTLHREQPFDLIHAHYASPSGVIALLARRWMKVPVVLSVHGSDVSYTARQNSLSAAVIRWVFHNVDAIIANSSWTTGEIVRHGGKKDKIYIVRLGADPPGEFQADTTLSRGGSAVLLSVGNLYPAKGQAYVIRAFRRLLELGYSLNYIIVGDGSERESLETLVRQLKLEHVIQFEGYKSHTDVWPYYQRCDIFVLPSWVEGFGVVFIEALRLGRPVIGCEGTGGPEDLRMLGDCIELVKPRDVDSLVEALRRLLDDPQRRQHMGRIGQRVVAEYFTWQRNATDTLAIYRCTLSSHMV